MPISHEPSAPLSSEPTVIVNKTPDSPLVKVVNALKIPLLLITILIASGIIGFYLGRNSGRDLGSPIPAHIKQLIEHPALSNWSAKVKGRVVQKTATFFTLAPADNQTATSSAIMKITYLPNKTLFENISYENLSAGTVLIGDVKLGQTKGRWEVVGKNFLVIPTKK